MTTGSLVKLNVESDGSVEIGPYTGSEPTPCDYVVNVDTEKRCMWCGRTIEVETYSMPVEYSKKYNIYKFRGMYCSLNCLQAQNFSANKGSYIMYDITCWVNKIAIEQGIPLPIVPASAREDLEVFGGTVSYDGFLRIQACRTTST